MRIIAIEAHVLSTRNQSDKAYEDTAGLKFPGEIYSDDVIGCSDQRHLCVYPSDRSTVLVKVVAANGLIGIGEAHAPVAPRVVCTIIEDLLAPLLIGEDARQIGLLWERMFSAMHLRSHTQGFTLEAMAGIDIALWDLLGKYRQEPIWLCCWAVLTGDSYPYMPPAHRAGQYRKR